MHFGLKGVQKELKGVQNSLKTVQNRPKSVQKHFGPLEKGVSNGESPIRVYD